MRGFVAGVVVTGVVFAAAAGVVFGAVVVGAAADAVVAGGAAFGRGVGEPFSSR